MVTANVSTLDASLPQADLARLRRMKRFATGFLVIAAGGYAATFAVADGGSGVVGFVRAGTEAAMIGGLADWFAVTALFRRPLHLPIPHTAIIPEHKDEIAAKLGGFVTANFLTPEITTRHLADARVVAKAGAWLREPANADGLAAEVSRLLAAALDALDEDAVFEYVLDLARRDVGRRSYAPMLGQLLARAVEGDAQRPLVDVLAARSERYLRDNRETLRPQLKEYLASKHFLAWILVTDHRTDRLIDFGLRELDEIRADPQHPLRLRLDDLLRTVAVDLQTRSPAAIRVDVATRRLLEDPRFQQPLGRFVEEATESLRTALAEAPGGLQMRISRFIQDLGARICTDPELEVRLEALLDRAVTHALTEYGDELTVLIRRTVASWNPTAASRRIEVAVGRDLQFIRINGTVVGAAAGLAIHAITIAL
jgi:uncharacterized membrane-anchored protein YjiN (DUF445 family)